MGVHVQRGSSLEDLGNRTGSKLKSRLNFQARYRSGLLKLVFGNSYLGHNMGLEITTPFFAHSLVLSIDEQR